MSETKAILVIGAGPGLGGAVARRFAREGYVACVARRKAQELEPLCKEIEDAGGRAVPFSVDARDEDEVIALFDRIESEVGPVDVAVHNVGANVSFPIRETSTRKYFKVWQMACFSGFLMGREAARRMVPRGRGSILFTGATASLRGRTGMSCFASAKFALRALAQSMARELGPEGVHVAHFIIDGAIDMPWIRENFPQIVEERGVEALAQPDDIAESYWTVHSQPRSAWTHEIDLRPHLETW